MTITIEQLPKLARFSKPEILVLLACRWFDVRQVAATRVQIVQATEMHERCVNETLRDLEKKGALQRKWNGSKKSPRASFFVKVNLDPAAPCSPPSTWSPGLHVHGVPGSKSTFTVKSDRSVNRPSVQEGRDFDPSGDGRTDGFFELPERVRKVIEKHWPLVPRKAFVDGIKRIAVLDFSEDEHCRFIEELYAHVHRDVKCSAFEKLGEYPVGSAYSVQRAAQWRSKGDALRPATPVIDRRPRSRKARPQPPRVNIEENIARAKRALDGR